MNLQRSLGFIVPLKPSKQIENGDLILIYPKPDSIYLVKGDFWGAGCFSDPPSGNMLHNAAASMDTTDYPVVS